MRIQGNSGRYDEGEDDHKQSFSLKFRTQYGCSESAPLNAASATDEFDTLILRAGHDKGWGAHSADQHARATCRLR